MIFSIFFSFLQKNNSFQFIITIFLKNSFKIIASMKEQRRKKPVNNDFRLVLELIGGQTLFFFCCITQCHCKRVWIFSSILFKNQCWTKQQHSNCNVGMNALWMWWHKRIFLWLSTQFLTILQRKQAIAFKHLYFWYIEVGCNKPLTACTELFFAWHFISIDILCLNRIASSWIESNRSQSIYFSRWMYVLCAENCLFLYQSAAHSALVFSQ